MSDEELTDFSDWRVPPKPDREVIADLRADLARVQALASEEILARHDLEDEVERLRAALREIREGAKERHGYLAIERIAREALSEGTDK